MHEGEGSVHRAAWPEAGVYEAAAGDVSADVLDWAGKALAELRGLKSQAKVSMKTPILSATLAAPAEAVEAIDAALGDIAEAGRVTGPLTVVEAAAALPLPAENFRMDDPTAEIPAGGVSASECTVNFVGLDALDFSEDQTYVLPVRLTEASGVDILTSRSVNFFVIREAALINVVGDIEGSYLDVEWKDPSPVSSMTQMTAEALVRFRNFDREITTLMGVEGKFLIRVGDSSFPSDQIQVTNGSYAKFPTVGNTANALPVNEWVHIAVTYDSGRLCIYVNGKLQSSGTCGYGAVNWGTYAAIDQEQSTRGFHIGYSYERKRELAGEIAEVRIWNRVLTADEIAAPDHFYTVDPASENLVAYWKFNDGAGNVVRDWSPYGNDATAPEGMKWTQVELPEK